MPDKLRGLPGLNRLSNEDRERFLLSNEEKLKQFKGDPELYNMAAERLYNNQLFKNKFGQDSIKKAKESGISYEDRNTLLKDAVVNEAFSKRFKPKVKNGIRDNNTGLGSSWEEYNNGLSVDSKLKALESDYKTPEEIRKEEQDWQNQLNNSWAPIRWAGKAMDSLIGEGIRQHKREANDKILQRIYNDEADSAERRLGSEISSAYMDSNIIGKDDTDTVKKFIKSITPNSYVDENGMPNLGIPDFAAHYGNGKDVSSAMKNFSIDDMRQILAKKAVYDQYLSPQMAATALNNEAKRYLRDHQSGWDVLNLFGNDLLISTLSYTADKGNGLKNFWLMLKDKMGGSLPVVYMDDEGNVLDPNKIKILSNRGNLFYDDANGKRHAVHKQQLSRTTLHNLGKNEDGSDYDGWLDPTYWTKAEQFGTLNEDEQRQYEQIGASPHQVVWDPNTDSNIWYESFKMMSFGLADGAMMFAPFGVGLAGRTLSTASKVGSVGKVVGDTMNKIGTALSAQSKLGATAGGLIGAGGIAYAYQRGAFQETLAKNLANAEEAMHNASQQDIYKLYNSDKAYKNQVDSLINARAASKKANYLAQMSQGNTQPIDEKTLDAEARNQAREEIMNELIQSRINERKSSKEYSDLQQKAIDSAGDAATAAFLPEAIKYGLVNTIGFRNFLYKHPTSLAQKAAKNFEGLTEKELQNGKKRIVLNSKFGTVGQKAKQWGKVAKSQIWGGAWTNGTDDMMVDAAERINDDSYARYLAAYENGDTIADTYGPLDWLHSYYKGLSNSTGQATTLNAALVGGLGSILSATPHFANIAHLASKEGRDAYRKRYKERTKLNEDGTIARDKDGNPITEEISLGENWRDRVDYFIQNGLLNTYYGNKQNERTLQEHANYVNNILDNNEDFDSIKDLLGAAQGVDTANSKGDSRTMQYIHALETARNLEKMGNSESDPLTLSSVVRNMKTLTDRLSSMESIDEIEEGEREDLLKSFYANNPGLDKNAEHDAMALQEIIKNAQMFKAAQEAYDAAEEQVADIDKKYFDVRDRLKINRALTNHWKDRIDSMRSEVSDTSDLEGEADGETLISSVGGKKGANTLIGLYDRQAEEIKKAIEELKNKVVRFKVAAETSEKALKDMDEGANAEAIGLATATTTQFKIAHESVQQQVKHLEEMLFATEEKKRKLQDALDAREEGAKDKVLTANEIFNLDPISRARMLREENQALYTKRQRAEIEKLKTRLKSNGTPDVLEKIQDIALLTQRVKTNDTAFYRMSEHPEAASYMLEMQRVNAAKNAYRTINKRNAQAAATYLSQAERALRGRRDVSQDDINTFVYRALRTLNTDYLNTIQEDGLLPNFHKQLLDAKGWGKTVNDIMAVIGQSNRSEEEKQTLLNDIAASIEEAKDSPGIMTQLEKAVSDLRESIPAKSKSIEGLIKDLQRIGYQRDATVIENEKKRAEREQKQAERNQNAEQALRENNPATTTATSPEPKADEGKTYKDYDHTVNQNSIDSSTIDDYLKLHPENEEDFDEDTKNHFRNNPTDIRKQLGMEVGNTVKYLNSEMSAKDYLESIGYPIESMDEEDIQLSALDMAELYKGYINRSPKKKSASSTTPAISTPSSPSFKRETTLKEEASTSEASSKPSQIKAAPSETKEKKETTATDETVATGEESPTKEFDSPLSKEEQEDIRFIIDYLKLAIEDDDVSVDAPDRREKRNAFAQKHPKFYRFVKANKLLSTGDHYRSLPTIDAVFGDLIHKLNPSLSAGNVSVQTAASLNGNMNVNVVTDSEGKEYGSPTNFLLAAVQTGGKNANKSYYAERRQKYLDLLGLSTDLFIALEDILKNGYPQREAPIEDVVTEVKIGDYEGVMVTSDSVERQAEEAKKEGKEVTLSNVDGLPNASTENNVGESMEENAFDYWAGNAMAEFIIHTAKAIRKIFHKGGNKAHDSMSDYYKWLEVTKTNLQNIIDDELPQILKEDSDIKVKFMVPKEGTILNIPDYGPIKLGNHVMLVLDYEGMVKDIHEQYINGDEYNNGGVITSNGKQYLLIGNIGYGDWRRADNAQRMQLFNELFRNNGKISKEKRDFFAKNPSESFYVSEDAYTKIVKGSPLPGYIFHQFEEESASEYRTLSEIFKDGKRNPHGINFENAIWMIQGREGAFLTNASDVDNFMWVEDDEKNAGNTFLMVPAGNGRLIPIEMRATRLQDIKNGTLQDEINHLIEIIGNPQSTYDQRLTATKSLRSSLYLDKDGNWILLDPKHPIISLKREGEVEPFASFNLERGDYTLDTFKKAMLDMNPRINITLSTITNPSRLKIYDEAGALTTNSAKLGTVGSRYLVYTTDNTGVPIGVEEDVFSSGGDNLPQYQQPKTEGVVYKGLNYYKQGDSFYLNRKKVEDPDIVRDLEYNHRVMYTPIHHTSQENGWKYYILTSGENPEVIRIKEKDYAVEVLGEQEARDYIAEARKKREALERKEAAEEALRKQQEEAKKEEEAALSNMPAENIIIDPSTGDVIVIDTATGEVKEVLSEEEKQAKDPNEGKSDEEDSTEIQDGTEDGDAALTATETPTTMSFSEIISDINNMETITFAIMDKWPEAPMESFEEMENFLRSKGVETESIGTSEAALNAWIETFKSCRE